MKRILLVEDETDIRTDLELVLKEAGYEVEAVSTATAAAVAVQERKYHLVVTDWRLSDGDGVSIADTAAEADAKVILITGFGRDMQDRTRHPLMFKPFRSMELVRAVTKQIGPAAA